LRLHSYVLDHDYGFAPNPFYGVCTLATCKPRIREHAKLGDYVVGTGCAKRKRRGYLIYLMRVSEITTFDEYWNDPRFIQKRPLLCGSKKQSFGDNVYHRDPATGIWHQENSLHSFHDGSVNFANLRRDTQSTRVLIGVEYAYWGGSGPRIPDDFRNWHGVDICANRGHKNKFPEDLVESFLGWARSLEQQGYLSTPLDWKYSG
jgi:hypothetical protein